MHIGVARASRGRSDFSPSHLHLRKRTRTHGLSDNFQIDKYNMDVILLTTYSLCILKIYIMVFFGMYSL